MANLTQIQRGFAMFIDNEVAAAFDGWQKAVVGGAAALFASNIPNLMKVYGKNQIVVAMGIYDAASGNVNIDALYNAFAPKLGNDKIPITIPKIGTIKMGRDELETLMRYIKEA